MKKPRLAFLGAGAIAHFHARAAVAAGFELTEVAASPNSSKVSLFASEFGFRTSYSDPDKLLNSSEWDALLICSSHDTLLPYLNMLLDQPRPVLVEKPVAVRSADLLPMLTPESDHVAVAFNRRHYLPVLAAKEFFSISEGCVVTVQIPETANLQIRNPDQRFRNVFTNSVHMLDLVYWITGSSNLLNLEQKQDSQSTFGAALFGNTERGDLVVIKSSWNSPSNFSITLESGAQRFALSPIEKAQRFKGFEIREPTDSMPIRVYSPQLVEEFSLDPKYRNFKPGFVEQMLDFKALVQEGAFSKKLSSLTDAHKALSLADKLVGVR